MAIFCFIVVITFGLLPSIAFLTGPGGWDEYAVPKRQSLTKEKRRWVTT